jgi:DNA gyrase subunit B
MNKKYKYIKNDEELEAFREANKGKSYQVNRMKGLGEMNEEETEETLTDPNQRIIKQITVDDIQATNILFNDLMGTAIVPRKKFIQEHSKEAIGNV